MTDIEKNVQHPIHYGGEDNPYEVIKVLEAWGLENDAYLWNVVKYIARAGKKHGNSALQDLKKAQFYLERRIEGMTDVIGIETAVIPPATACAAATVSTIKYEQYN